MVISSELNEKKPPGGSNFAGHFNNAAFAAYIFPKGLDSSKPALDQNPAFKRKLQRHEHRALTAHPATMHNSHVDFALAKESVQPSRLRTSFYEQKTKLGSSSSSPAMMAPAEQATSGGEFDMAARASSSSFGSAAPPPHWSSPSQTQTSNMDAAIPPGTDPQTAAAMTMNTRWYPHPSTSRGTLKLTGPKSLHYSIDPGKEGEHKDSFYEGRAHRFQHVTTLPERRPRTPTKSIRWRSAAAWEDPENHPALKVTHTMGGSMRASSTQNGKWEGLTRGE